jgi:hypothetical protein
MSCVDGVGVGPAVTAGVHPAIQTSEMLMSKKKDIERFMVMLLL